MPIQWLLGQYIVSLLYSLKNLKVEFTYKQIDQFMEAYQYLSPFPDAIEGLNRLNEKYDLVMLSNGEQSYLEHLAKNRIKFDFHSILSAETVDNFKPHPYVSFYKLKS